MKQEEINLTKIEANTNSRSLTFFVSSDFKDAFKKLKTAINIEPYQDSRLDVEYPTLIRFLFEEDRYLEFYFKESIDIEFITFSLKSFDLFLTDCKSNETKLIKTISKDFLMKF